MNGKLLWILSLYFSKSVYSFAQMKIAEAIWSLILKRRAYQHIFVCMQAFCCPSSFLFCWSHPENGWKRSKRKKNELICVPDVTQLYDWRKQHNIWHVFLIAPYFNEFSLLPSTVLEIESPSLSHSHSLGMDLKGHETFLASPFLRSSYTTKADTFLLKEKDLWFKIVCIWNL